MQVVRIPDRAGVTGEEQSGQGQAQRGLTTEHHVVCRVISHHPQPGQADTYRPDRSARASGLQARACTARTQAISLSYRARGASAALPLFAFVAPVFATPLVLLLTPLPAPTASLSASSFGVFSQVNSGSSRPK